MMNYKMLYETSFLKTKVTERKQNIIKKILKFFEKYFGLNIKTREDDEYEYNIDEIQDYNEMVAEDDEDYNTDE